MGAQSRMHVYPPISHSYDGIPKSVPEQKGFGLLCHTVRAPPNSEFPVHRKEVPACWMGIDSAKDQLKELTP